MSINHFHFGSQLFAFFFRTGHFRPSVHRLIYTVCYWEFLRWFCRWGQTGFFFKRNIFSQSSSEFWLYCFEVVFTKCNSLCCIIKNFNEVWRIICYNLTVCPVVSVIISFPKFLNFCITTKLYAELLILCEIEYTRYTI